jgi:hypothetical protein
MNRLVRAALATVAPLAAGVATAADLPTKKPAPAPVPIVQVSPWRIELTGYGWASSLAGNSGFGALPTLPYYASFGKVLEHFEGGLMGAVTASNGVYLVGLDALGSRVGGSGTVKVSNGPLNAAGVDLTLTEAVVTPFGGLRIPIGPPNLELYGTVGARYVYSGTKLTLNTPVPGFSLSQSADKGWINPIAGFVAHYRFDDHWFTNVLGDLGGWSDSATGQALATVGYNWTSNFATTLGYRVMYNYEKQNTGFSYLQFAPTSFRFQQWMYGPLIGAKFSF